MTDIIVIAILAVILGAAVRYIYKAKKSGAKCIGCSVSTCSGSCGGCTCSGETAEKNSAASCCCCGSENK